MGAYDESVEVEYSRDGGRTWHGRNCEHHAPDSPRLALVRRGESTVTIPPSKLIYRRVVR